MTEISEFFDWLKENITKNEFEKIEELYQMWKYSLQ